MVSPLIRHLAVYHCYSIGNNLGHSSGHTTAEVAPFESEYRKRRSRMDISAVRAPNNRRNLNEKIIIEYWIGGYRASGVGPDFIHNDDDYDNRLRHDY